MLDTNICIYYIKGLYDLNKKINQVGESNCFISEITLAELKFGVENSTQKEKNKKSLENFTTGISTIPIFHSLDLYAKEKSKLRKSGISVDDFDLLIGVTAVNHSLIMVTNNAKHFEKIENIILENWTN